MTAIKVAENALRRACRRYGLTLHKARGKIGLRNRGGYQIRDDRGTVAHGPLYDLSLEKVGAILDEIERDIAI